MPDTPPRQQTPSRKEPWIERALDVVKLQPDRRRNLIRQL